MKTFIDCLKACEATTKKEPKMKALETLSEDGKRLMVYALSGYITYGIKKYSLQPGAEEDSSIEYFFTLLDQLSKRQVTGNAARDFVEQTLASYTSETQSYLTRILQKDLKAGMSLKTVNKVHKDLVPVFECMLAKKITEKTKWEDILPAFVDDKLDGVRCVVYCIDGKVEYYSRNGIEMDYCNGLFDHEVRRIEEIYGYPVALDGEIRGEDFKKTLKARKEGNDKDKAGLELHLFEILPYETWINQGETEIQTVRINKMTYNLQLANCELIVPIEREFCTTKEQVYDFYEKMVSKGEEGIVLKVANGTYEWKRSKYWLKLKPELDLDGEIVEILEGEKDKQFEGTCGSITVEGTDENGTFFRTNIASGFKKKDGMRDKMWANPNDYIGKMVEFVGDCLSKADKKDVHSVRFGRFKRFRPDKD